jgi:hypothetical protein
MLHTNSNNLPVPSLPVCCRQVEVWPSGLSSIAAEALLVTRQEVTALNSIILSKVRPLTLTPAGHKLCAVVQIGRLAQ